MSSLVVFQTDSLYSCPVATADSSSIQIVPILKTSSESDSTDSTVSASSASTNFSALSSTSVDSTESTIINSDFVPAFTDSQKMSDISSQQSDAVSQTRFPPVSATPDVVYAANDDSVIQYEPSQHVDYLSHNWQESDISSSWRYIVLRRKDVANSARLENASWRTWTKAKYNLKTVSPESVNWLKDYDVTWLYGPLYTQRDRPFMDTSPVHSPSIPYTPTNAVSATTTAGVPSPPLPSAKKPILKKRSVSDVMLSQSISSSNLLKQAAASVKAQRHLRAPGTTPTTASYSSSRSPYASVSDDPHDPRFPSSLVARSFAASNANFSDRLTHSSNRPRNPGETKHIHFSDRVEQCIALEVKDEDDDTSNSLLFSGASSATSTDEEDADDEPGLFLMVRSASGSFQRPATLEPHTIAKLPATKLKSVHDADETPSALSYNAGRSAYFSMGADQDEDDSDDQAGNVADDDEDDYLSYGHHHRHSHRSHAEPQYRYTESSTSDGEIRSRPALVSRSSSSNLLGSSSTNFHSSSLQQPQINYIENSSSAEHIYEDSDGSETMSDDDVVDMDSSLLASLRRDSVVLARGRINDVLPNTVIDHAASNQNSVGLSVVNKEPREQLDSSLATLRRSSSQRSSSTELVSSVLSEVAPEHVDADGEEEAGTETGDEDKSASEPHGLWGHLSQALSATKDLAVVFWKGGFQNK
ncbi:hypothetical protein V1512DRAFT_293190 [Lipomyces arxii]|uniref:uncharacterized protein n=1 Tax=Lipomyces arxii TaxID=56418 RepID=UPI0034CE5477